MQKCILNTETLNIKCIRDNCEKINCWLPPISFLIPFRYLQIVAVLCNNVTKLNTSVYILNFVQKLVIMWLNVYQNCCSLWRNFSKDGKEMNEGLSGNMKFWINYVVLQHMLINDDIYEKYDICLYINTYPIHVYITLCLKVFSFLLHIYGNVISRNFTIVRSIIFHIIWDVGLD